MEQEIFLTGYCRALDQSRLVTAVIEDGIVCEQDCAYPACPHTPVCDIAKKLQAQTE